jgi:hypothetical protein
LAAIRLNPCHNKDCSAYAPHKCKVTEWLTPPIQDDADWNLIFRRSGKYILHYYKRQEPQETTIPQLVYINDILIIKIDKFDLATDMEPQDITWLQQNLKILL